MKLIAFDEREWWPRGGKSSPIPSSVRMLSARLLFRTVIAALVLLGAPGTLHADSIKANPGVSLIFGSSDVFAADDDPVVDQIVDALTESGPGSDKFEQALKNAPSLTDAQAAAIAQKVLDKIRGDAQQAAKVLFNLAKLGLKAAPKNGPLKKLTKKLLDALQKALGNLLKLLTDPRNVVHGKLQLNKILEDLGIVDINRRMDIIDILERAIKAEEESAKNEKSGLKSTSSRSVSFDASTRTLSFSSDFVTGVFDFQSGLTDLTDIIVGAEVSIPSFVFDGFTPEGEPGFFNPTTDNLIVRKGTDVFFEGFVPYLIWNGSSLVGFITELSISGASTGSPYDGGLPDLGSAYVDGLNSQLGPFDYKFYFDLVITPERDIVAGSNNFADDFSAPFTNVMATGSVAETPVPEPTTLTLFGIGAGVLAVRRWRARSRLRLPRRQTNL